MTFFIIIAAALLFCIAVTIRLVSVIFVLRRDLATSRRQSEILRERCDRQEDEIERLLALLPHDAWDRVVGGRMRDDHARIIRTCAQDSPDA